MEILVQLLLTILLRQDVCQMPQVPEPTCEEYRLEGYAKPKIATECKVDYQGNWEVLIVEDSVWELWHNDRPSFKRGKAVTIWKNIENIKIERPDYCDLPIY